MQVVIRLQAIIHVYGLANPQFHITWLGTCLSSYNHTTWTSTHCKCLWLLCLAVVCLCDLATPAILDVLSTLWSGGFIKKVKGENSEKSCDGSAIDVRLTCGIGYFCPQVVVQLFVREEVGIISATCYRRNWSALQWFCVGIYGTKNY